MMEFRTSISQGESISMLPVFVSIAVNVDPSVSVRIEPLPSGTKELVCIGFDSPPKAERFLGRLEQLQLMPLNWSLQEYTTH